MKTKLTGNLLGAGMLCLASGCASSLMKPTPFYAGRETAYTGPAEERVNLWPLAYHRAPATSILWPVWSMADDHVALRPFFSLYRSSPASNDAQYSYLWPLSQIDTHTGEGWIFPFFWAKDSLWAGPFYHTDENLGKNEKNCYVWPLLSWGHTSTKSDAFSSYVLLGLGGCEKNAEGKGSSWCLPLYYHKDDTAFYSLLYSWGEEEKCRTTAWLTPLVGTWSGSQKGSWLFPFFSDKESANYDTLHDELERDTHTRSLGHAQGQGNVFGVFNWSSQIHEDAADTNTCTVTEQKIASCGFAYDVKSAHEAVFDRSTGKRLGEKQHATANVLGFVYDAEGTHDTFRSLDRERSRILYALWHREEINGSVSLDVFPGYTYDSKTNGYVKASLWWRMFRYEKKPGENPEIDLFFLPISR